MALPVREMTLTEAVDTTRSGSAWYFDENGVFQEESTSDTARIDYDPNGGARLGLMSEGQSTNLVPVSTPGGGWADLRGATTEGGDEITFASNIVLPKFTEDGTAGQHSQAESCSIASGDTAYTYSTYVKINGRALELNITTNAGHGVRVVTSTGASAAFSVNLGSGTGTGNRFTLVDAAQSIYRVEVSFTVPTGGSSITVLHRGYDGAISYTGDGVSGWYAGGCQLEALPGASSLIPTTGSTVTRAAETHELVSLDPWYRASGYSVAVQARLRNVTSNQTLLALHDGDSENSVTVDLLGSASDPRVIVETGNVVQATIQSADAVSAYADFKISARIAANDFAASIDGNTSITDTSGDLPSPATTMVLGQSADDTLPMYGWIQDLKYTTTLWSDAELATESGTTV